MRFMFWRDSYIIENMEDSIQISAVEPQKRKKDRYNIYADGQYVASLGAEAVVAYGIRTGAEIPETQLREAVEKDNAAYALDCAAATLAHGQRTRAELERKLKERGIDDAAAGAALDKLASYGYIDDAAYAAEFVRSMMETGRLGRKGVEYKLKEKGIAADVAAEAMKEYTAEEEREIAKRQLARMSGGGDLREQRRKLSAALIRHGFSYDVFSSLFSEEED